MVNIVQALVNWITLSPLKGYRTKIFSTIQFLLAGVYSLNLWNIKSHLTADQIIQIQGVLSAATGLAAASHVNGPPPAHP